VETADRGGLEIIFVMEREKSDYRPEGLDEFRLFLFIMLANSDGEMDLSEINHLFERLDEHTFSANLPGNSLLVARVYKAWHGMNDEMRFELVREELDRYYLSKRDVKGAQKLIAEMRGLIMADGKTSEEEVRMLARVEGLLGFI